MKVYLAGPITGLSFNESVDWRNYFTTQSKNSGITFFDPLRGKSFLKDSTEVIEAVDTSERVMVSSKFIMDRDYNDVVTSDLIVFNMLNAERISLGTVMEMAWAYQLQIPRVTIIERTNVHRHAMFNEASGIEVQDLDTAIEVVENFLLP